MTDNLAAWQALIWLWQRGAAEDWREVRLALAEAQGMVLLIEALAPAPCERVFVDVLEQAVTFVRMIGGETL